MPPPGHSHARCGRSSHRAQGGIPREDGPGGLGVAEPPGRRAGAPGRAYQGTVWSRVCGAWGSVGWAGQVRTVGYDQGSRQLPGQAEDVCAGIQLGQVCQAQDEGCFRGGQTPRGKDFLALTSVVALETHHPSLTRRRTSEPDRGAACTMPDQPSSNLSRPPKIGEVREAVTAQRSLRRC